MFGVAMALPVLVALSLVLGWLVRPRTRSVPVAPATAAGGPLGGGKARLVLLVGLGYAAFGVALEMLKVPYSQEIVLVVSMMLISLLLQQVGISRGVAVASIVIFLFRATPGVGQGYCYWAVDRLGFDETFLGILAQVTAVLEPASACSSSARRSSSDR